MDLKHHKLSNLIGHWKYQLVLLGRPLGQDNHILMVEFRMTIL